MPAPIALQLYTVRKVAAEKGYLDTVREVAEIGYAGVEPAGFSGSNVQEASKLFRELGLAVPAAHVPLPVGEKKNETIETMKALGSKRAISGLGPDHFKTLELIKAACDKFNEAAANCRAAGLQFGIHNHWWEYETVEGRLPYRSMLAHLSPDVFFELDTYWAQTGGSDPASVLYEIGERVPLLHIKDGPAEPKVPQTAVGEGRLDFPRIIEAAGDHVEWLVVELDECATDMMEAVRKSYTYLVSKGLGRGKTS